MRHPKNDYRFMRVLLSNLLNDIHM